MKKNIMKKVLSSLCALVMAAAPLSAMAAAPLRDPTSSLVIYNWNQEQLHCWVVGTDEKGNDYDTFTISSPYSSEIVVLPGDEVEFRPYYGVYGRELGTDPLFFNFTLNCRNAAGEIKQTKNMRAQYAMYGDLNGDGKIDHTDANIVSFFATTDLSIEGNTETYYYFESLLAMMDFNTDLKIDSKDATILSNYIAGKNPSTHKQIGSMMWATLDNDTMYYLHMSNIGETKLNIENSLGDVIFHLYAV